MFCVEMGQCPVASVRIKLWRCHYLAARNTAFSGVLRSTEFFDSTPHEHQRKHLRFCWCFFVPVLLCGRVRVFVG